MKRLYVDLETFSLLSLASCGSHRYAENCSVLLFGWAIDDEPASVWDLTAEPFMPEPLREALEGSADIVMHNGAMFDAVVLRYASNIKIDIPYRRIDDTMVKALSHGLPGSLMDLSQVYGLPQDKAKDKDGRRLVLKFCKPDSRGVTHNRFTDPDDWARFVDYCRLDVESMREIHKKLPSWNWQEADRRLFALDQVINNRGMRIDVDLAKAAIALSSKLRIDNETKALELTGGAVRAASQRDALLQHILSVYGVSLPDLQKSTIERRLADETIPNEVKELLRLRLASTKNSVAKYKRLLDVVSSDGRLRGSLQFRGASRTGRYAGRLFQPQNLPRPTLPDWIVDIGVDAIKGGYADLVAEPAELLSNCLRGEIIASEGKKLYVADLSNIEGRMLAWLAGETWKLKAFRRFDAGDGPDLYKATYARTFGVRPDEVTKQQRQIGKVMELALGYQGGVGAFLTFAAAYRIDLDELAAHVAESIQPKYWALATNNYDWFKSKKLTHGLKKNTFIACEAVKLAWREAHPAITAFWRAAEEAAIRALNGGSTAPISAGKLRFDRRGAWLRMRLPSGRYLCYPGARVEAEGGENDRLSYMGVDQYSRNWTRIQTYAGRIVENSTQGAAADVLIEAMPRIEQAGFEIVLSVHDEFITESRPGRSSDELCALMSAPPAWAPDLPLAAAGFTSDRYKKD